jgi:predicted MFS family arabinose efflux permease
MSRMSAASRRPGRRPPGGAAERARPVELVWAATVGLVLADSSVVTLALPDILRRFETTVFGVSWVLTAFNIVLALAVVPAARLSAGRGATGAARVWAGGVAVFAAASLLCTLAPAIGVLIVGRCLQGLGGACVIAGAIELLARSRGSHAAAASAWGGAGLVGLAVGPAAGGLLTELISWQAIFALQVPVAFVAVLAARPPVGAAERGSAGALRLAPELALGLVSAGLTGALFLLVIMLTEGWGHSPLEAALIVSAMPAATVVVGVLIRRLAESGPVMAAGAVALAGGLAALGLLPDAAPVWTLVPQTLIGVGIALALPGLTGRALGGADPAGHRAAGTIAARHAGIVLGLLLLTPLFTAELGDQQRAAERSGTALILDAALSPQTKLALGAAIDERIDRADGRLPDLAPAFREVTPPPEALREYAGLQRRLADEVDKAATHAFSAVFLVAAALALLAVAPIGPPRPRRSAPVVAAAAASAGLVGAYLALGGAGYQPLEPADPCQARPVEQLRASDQIMERIALSALDGAACRLQVTREELVLALASEEARAEFAERHRIGTEAMDQAVRSGLDRSIDDARRMGAISSLEAELLDGAVGALPVRTLIDALQSAPGRRALDFLLELLQAAGERGREAGVGPSAGLGTRARCGAASWRLGQLERSPTSAITAGVRTERTRNASISRPTASTKASCWKAVTGTRASAANEAASTRPAAEIACEAPLPAAMIASSSERLPASLQMRPTRKML